MKLLLKQALGQAQESKNYKILRDFVRDNQIVIFTLIVGTIFVDSLFIKNSSDFVMFGTVLLYVVFAHFVGMKSKTTFLLCLGLLSMMFVYFLFTRASIATEKLAVWLYLFLIVGIIQQWHA